MSDPQVTITLGRSGQVVTKRGKQSRGEIFGSNGHILSSSNKRQRGDGMKFNPGIDGVNGSRIAQNDLRLKLMRKRLAKQSQNGVRECKDTEPSRKPSAAIQTATSSYLLSQRLDPNRSSLSRQIFPKEIATSSHQMDSLGRFYSPRSQTMGGSTARSPDIIFKNSGRLSPPRSFNGVQQIPFMGIPDAPRSGPFYSNEVYDSSRLKASSRAGSQVTRPAAATGMQKVSHMEPLTVAGFLHSLGLRKYAVLFQAEEAQMTHLMIEMLLRWLDNDTSRYDPRKAPIAKVDMTVLKQMRDNDLKEMGIPMGPRKKILLALMPRPK